MILRNKGPPRVFDRPSPVPPLVRLASRRNSEGCGEVKPTTDPCCAVSQDSSGINHAGVLDNTLRSGGLSRSENPAKNLASKQYDHKCSSCGPQSRHQDRSLVGCKHSAPTHNAFRRRTGLHRPHVSFPLALAATRWRLVIPGSYCRYSQWQGPRRQSKHNEYKWRRGRERQRCHLGIGEAKESSG